MGLPDILVGAHNSARKIQLPPLSHEAGGSVGMLSWPEVLPDDPSRKFGLYCASEPTGPENPGGAAKVSWTGSVEPFDLTIMTAADCPSAEMALAGGAEITWSVNGPFVGDGGAVQL